MASVPGRNVGPLLAVLYSEFDNIKGPTIIYQAPEGFLCQEIFESISDYVITGKQLSGRVLTITAFNYQIMGCPLSIENEKYFRNALLFNISLVFEASFNPTPYEALLRKIALTLYSMEIETEFLFKPAKKAMLTKILPKLLKDLNQRGECILPLDEANLLSLKLCEEVQEPQPIFDHEVPVFLRDPDVLKSLDWDLAMKQAIPHIDGVKFVKRLAIDAEMDMDCLQKALRTLLYYNMIALIDVFQFSNVYCTTEKLTAFTKDTRLQRKGQAYISNSLERVVKVLDMLRLYHAFSPKVTVADVVVQHIDLLDTVDPRRLVTFGVVHGLLRRIHCYPVCIKAPSKPYSSVYSPNIVSGALALTGPPSTSSIAASATTQAGHHHHHHYHHHQHHHHHPPSSSVSQVHRIQDMMDGEHTADELCCRFLKSSQELDDIATSDDSQVIHLYK